MAREDQILEREESLQGFHYPTEREIREQFDGPMQRLFDVIEEEKLPDGGVALAEPEAEYGHKKSQPNARQDLTTSSLQKVDSAKLQIISQKLSKLAEKFKGKTDKHGVFTDLSSAIGAIKKTPNSSSDYAVIALPNGKEVEIRISNHNANAQTFAERGHTEGNISIVIKSRRSGNTFKAHEEVELTEYVYTTEAIANDGNMLSGIAESLQGLIKNGEYVDLTGKAIINRSPEGGEVMEPRGRRREAGLFEDERQRGLFDGLEDEGTGDSQQRTGGSEQRTVGSEQGAVNREQ